MCRWLVYSGMPVLLDEVIYKPAHSLIDQSQRARMGVETTNGDGFGIGWYAEEPEPAVFRGIGPAWSDRNLHEIAAHTRSPLFFAHIRASTGTAVQETNCHPFRHDRWLWMHNGAIAGFDLIKRDLVVAVDPALFGRIEGSTDSEIMFFLALTFGLDEDPPGAVARMVGLVEAIGRRNGIEHPMQMTVATTDGIRTWGFRYSSERRSRSLFYSTDVQTLRQTYPDVAALNLVSDETRIVVSEPLADLPGVWNEMPESSYKVIQEGPDELHPFAPRE